jgi:hypothetical protein
VLWPELRVRVPGFTPGTEMHGDRDLDRAMADVSALLEQGRDADASTAVALRFESVLREHLRIEESIVLPAFVYDLTSAVYLDIERRILATAPFSVMSFLQPWMSDGVDSRTVARMAAGIPPPVRLLGRTVLRRRYERLVGPVLAVR